MPRLTEREREVIALTSEGMSAKETAQRLGISHRTVEDHHKNVMRKLEARNIVAACCSALKLGLVSVMLYAGFSFFGADDKTSEEFVVDAVDASVVSCNKTDSPSSSVEEIEDVENVEKSPGCEQKRR